MTSKVSPTLIFAYKDLSWLHMLPCKSKRTVKCKYRWPGVDGAQVLVESDDSR